MNARHIFKTLSLGLTFLLSSVISFAQTASYHDHNIFHGAGTAFVNTSPQAQAVGDGGVLRAQLIWQGTPGQTKGADLDIHAKLPNGTGPYTVTQFDPVGALPGTPQKTPPFGNPNTASDGNQQVNWVNRQVVFSNGQAVASLDQDNRTGVANAPTGKLVENIYLQGTTNPNYIPSGVYQFAVHNYNQTKLADPTASYAVWITTNGRVGARSTTHSTLYENTANPTQPAFYGTLTAEGQSSEIYGIEIITPAGETPHAPGITVVDAKRKYLNAWHAEQARLAEIRRQQALYHQQMAEKAKAAEQQFCTNGYQSVACSTPGAFKFTPEVLTQFNAAPQIVDALIPSSKLKTGELDNFGVITDFALETAEKTTKKFGNYRIGSDFTIRGQTTNGGVFYGNQHVSTVGLAKVSKGIVFIGAVVDFVDQGGQIYEAVLDDKGTGKHTNVIVQTTGAVGDIGGSILGGVAGGALAGLACGPGAPVCSTVLGIGGGVLGALGGSALGEYSMEGTARFFTK